MSGWNGRGTCGGLPTKKSVFTPCWEKHHPCPHLFPTLDELISIPSGVRSDYVGVSKLWFHVFLVTHSSRVLPKCLVARIATVVVFEMVRSELCTFHVVLSSRILRKLNVHNTPISSTSALFVVHFDGEPATYQRRVLRAGETVSTASMEGELRRRQVSRAGDFSVGATKSASVTVTG